MQSNALFIYVHWTLEEAVKNIAIVGTGSRSGIYVSGICSTYKSIWSIKALCDSNPHRLEVAHKKITESHGLAGPALYGPDDFELMIAKHSIQLVIVTSMDRTHDEYIIRAMKSGCDVITEKPLTIDAARLERIWRVMNETGKSLRVGFNYRYAPRNTKVKELLAAGTIGRVHSVHFEWLLDTSHGADYFRRWHRDKRNSGGLIVHKSTHHFDLMNWWLSDRPAAVFASGNLVFYGRENAEKRGVKIFYNRGTGSPEPKDPFALDLSKDPNLKALYLDAEQFDGYRRDESVFGNYISIEDDLSVIVEYQSGTRMTYHLTAYSPYEGFRVVFNGDKGRLEYDVLEATYVSGSMTDIIRAGGTARKIGEKVKIRVIPHWQEGYEVDIGESSAGGHGGGDSRLLADLFADPKPADPFACAAGIEDGAYSIGVGIAANRSMAERRLVFINEIVPGEWAGH